ncbi:MAG: spermidine/putrescine ABC transporter substrate-binding protein, partial [Ruthenibacterium sp.]
LLSAEMRDSELMYPPQEILSRCETFEVLPDEINTAMDAAWSSVRSYDAGGGGWVMPLVLAAMLVMAGFGFWRKFARKRRNEY